MSSEPRPPAQPDAAPVRPIGARLAALVDARGRVSVSAWLVGERIDTRRIESGVIARAPTTLEAGSGLAVVYRYGAVVVFGVPKEAARAFLAQLAPFVHGPLPEPSGDTGELRLVAEDEDRVEADGVVALRQLELARLQIVAEALGRSALLAYYEARLAHSLERVEPLVASLRERGRVKLRSRHLLVELGDVLFTEMRMLGRAEVSEKPELTWDRPDLDRLYVRLAEAYELRDRDHAIGRKLELLTRTAATLLGLLQNRRSLTVEWYIVILIVVEMALAFLR